MGKVKIAICGACLVIVAILGYCYISEMQNEKYEYIVNSAISNLVDTVIEKYPDVREEEILNILIATIVMLLVLIGLKFVVPTSTTSRMISIGVVLLYSIIGAIVYLFVLYKTKSINNIFGEEKVKSLLNKKNKHKNITKKKDTKKRG